MVENAQLMLSVTLLCNIPCATGIIQESVIVMVFNTMTTPSDLPAATLPVGTRSVQSMQTVYVRLYKYAFRSLPFYMVTNNSNTYV